VAGLVGVGAGTVLAARATLQVEPILEKHLQHIKDIDSVMYVGSQDNVEEQRIKDKAAVYLDLTFDMTKLYGPAILASGIGVLCLTSSHHILTKRNAALTAAYAVLERSYDKYRENVRNSIGEDLERELHYNTEKELAEKNELLKQVGNKKGVKENYSQYAKFFDESNPNWTRSAEKNLSFLNVQQKIATDILLSKGFILLNDVYDMLGIPRTTAGCVVGWTVYGDGDNRVDFGIFNHHTDEVRGFINGWEKSVLLDFNVDGVVYDLIDRGY
jgi:Family of unknown function (DUF6353)